MKKSLFANAGSLALAILAALTLLAGQAKAVISVKDGSPVTIQYAAGTTVTPSVTVSSGATVLVVLVEDHNATVGSEPTNLTWNNQTLIRGAQQDHTATTTRGSAIYYLLNPPTGSAINLPVTVPTSDGTWVTWFTLAGTTNTAPLSGGVNSGGATSLAFNINNVAVGSWAVVNTTWASTANPAPITATPTGTTFQATDQTDNGTVSAAGYISNLTAGTVTFTATYANSQKANFAALVFAPIPPITISALTATPNNPAVGQSVALSASAISLNGTVTSVSVNASAIGGSTNLNLPLSGTPNIYTANVVVSGVAASNLPAVVSLPLTAIDSLTNSVGASISLTVVGQNVVWNGGGADNAWATGLNWLGGLAPVLGNQVTFAGTTKTNVNMESSYTLSGLSFSNNAGTFSITNAGVNTLNLSTNSGITNFSANSETVAVPIQMNGPVTLAATNGNLVFPLPLSGTGSFTASGPFTNILTGSNTFTTGFTIASNSSLVLGGAGLFNNGTLGAAIVDNGTFIFNSTSNQFLNGNGNISGTGGIIVNAAPGGFLQIGSSGNNETYTGPTVVNSGSLNLLFNNQGNSGIYQSSSLTINNGATVDLLNDNAYTGSSSPIGSLPTTVNAGGLLTGNSSAAGPSSHIRGILTLNGGTLAIGGTPGSGLPGTGNTAFGSWDLDDGMAVPGTSTTTSTISSLTVIPSQSGGTLFNITNGNTASGIDLNVTGTLIWGSSLSDTGIIKNGNGTMQLNGINTYRGNTTINGGTLILANPGLLGSTLTTTNTNGPTVFPNTTLYTASIFNNGTFISTTAAGPTVSNGVLFTLGQTLGGVISGTGTLAVYGPGAILALTNVNPYTGPTIVGTGGTLYLTNIATISASSIITISNGGTLDVTGVSNGITLAQNQTLNAGGTINGTFAAAVNTQIFPGTDGTYGTNTFNGSVNLAAGNTINMDLGTVIGGANDAIVINGPLTVANGNFVHIKVPSPASNLDQSGDYVLITATGGITGAFSGAPAFDVLPANAGHYSIVTTGTQVLLHFSTTLSPVITAVTVTPATNVVRNQSVAVAITVLSGSGTVNNVQVNLAPLNGTAQNFVLSSTPGVWTNSIFIPAGTLAGTYNLTATATDTTPLLGAGNVHFVVAVSTETWSGLGSDQNFDTNPNWVSTLAPGYVGDSLVFPGTVGLAPIVDHPYTVAALTFSNTAGAFVIGNTLTNNLTLAANSGVTNNSTAIQTFNLPVQLAGAATVAENTASGSVVFSQPISESFVGVGALTKTGAGTNVLQAVNTYTGGTTISAGTLLVQGTGQLGGGNYPGAIVDNGTFVYTSSATQNISGIISGSGGLTLNAPTSNTVLTIGQGLNATTAYTYTGPTVVNVGELDMNFGNQPTSGIYKSSSLTINSNGIVHALGSSALMGYTGQTTNLPVTINAGGILDVPPTAVGFSAHLFGILNLNGGTLGQHAQTMQQYGGWEIDAQVNVNGGALTSYIIDPQFIPGANPTIFNVTKGTTPTGIDLDIQGAIANTLGSPGNAVVFGGTGTTLLEGDNTYRAQMTISNVSTVILGPSASLNTDTLLFTGTTAGPAPVLTGSYAGNIINNGTLLDTSTKAQTLAGILSGTGLFKYTNGANVLYAGTNTYTGNTIVTNGSTLGLTGTGSFLNSSNIYLSSDSTYNVQTATAPVIGAQNFIGNGTVLLGAGGLGTTVGSVISPSNEGTNGVLGAQPLFFFGSGTISIIGTATAKFAVSASASGAQDQIFMGGGAAMSVFGAPVHIAAPSTATSLDQTSDYILVTGGTINGGFATTPIWDVRPPNANFFTIVSTPSQVSLHYSTSLPATAGGVITPTNVLRNQTVLLTVTVTNGTSPTISSVTANITQFGGGAAVPLTRQSLAGTVSVWTNSFVIPPTANPGLASLSVAVTDAANVLDIFGVTFQITASTEVWSGLGSNQSWDTNANWASLSAPGYFADSLLFAGSTGLAPVMDQNYSIVGLTFNTNAGSFVLGATNGDILTINGGVTNNSTKSQVINIPITNGAPVTFNALSNDLVFVQPIDTGTSLLTVTDGGHSTVLSNGVFDLGGLTKTGTGTNTLLGTNTFSGPLTISAGAVTIGTNALLYNAGTVGAYSAAITDAGTLNYFSGLPENFTGIISGAGGINIAGGTATNGTIVRLNALSTFTGNVTITNSYVSIPINNNNGTVTASGLGNPATAGRTVTVGTNAILSFDAGGGNELGGGGSVPNLGFIINAGGLMQITSGNSVIGPLTMNGGILSIASANTLQYEPIEIGGAITIGGTQASLITNTIDGPLRGINVGINATTGQSTFTVAATGVAGPDFIVAVPLADGGGIAPPGSVRGLIKAGAGIMALMDQNIYHGTTTINAGSLQVGSADLGGTNTGPLGIGGSIVFGGGALQYSISNQFDYSPRFGTGAGQLYKIDTASNTITLGTSLASTNGSLTKVGVGNLVITAPAIYSGTTTVSNGTLTFGGGSSVANSTNFSVSPGAILDVSAISPLTLASNQVLTGSGTTTAATINGTVNATAASPITLAYDGSHSALTVGTLSLGGNKFVINGSALAPSVTPYLIMSSANPITTNGTPFTASGTALSVINTNTVTVVGNNVLLTVTAPTFPTNGAVLAFTVQNKNLNFSWPPNYLGSALQSNSLGIVLISNIVATNNWVTIAGSTNVTNLTIPILTNTNVYYRLNTP